MANLPLVSVIVTLYNRELYVLETLGSIAGQDYPNIEIIVIDDGSTDNSNVLVSGYSCRFPLKIIRQENKGVSAAMNTGVSHAKGKYFVVPDSDDMLYSNAVSAFVDHMESNPRCGIVMGQITRVNSSGRIVRKQDKTRDYARWDFHGVLEDAIPVAGPWSCIRAEALMCTAGYVESIKAQDMQITLAITKVGWFADRLPIRTLYYRIHDDNMSSNIERGLARDMMIAELYKDCDGVNAFQRSVTLVAVRKALRERNDPDLAWKFLKGLPVSNWDHRAFTFCRRIFTRKVLNALKLTK